MAIGLPGDKNKRPNQHSTAHHPNWDRFISSTLYSNKIDRRRFCHVIPSSYGHSHLFLAGLLHVISKLIYRTLLIVFHNIIITKNNNNSYDHGNHRMECFVGSCPVVVLDLLLVSSSFSFNTFHKCLLVYPEEQPTTTTTFPL